MDVDGVAGQERYEASNFDYAGGFPGATPSPEKGVFKYFPIFVLLLPESGIAAPPESKVRHLYLATSKAESQGVRKIGS